MLSVAICTHNRCESLAYTLQTLAVQADVDWSQVEVIVVDNNCLDATLEVIDRFAGSLPIRRVAETTQGLSHARNRALAETQGDWIVFTDDDVLLDKGWLHAYQQAFEQ